MTVTADAPAPVGRAAVLVGAWGYQYLPPVPAAENSLRRMAALLTSARCGWSAQEVHQCRDPEAADGLPLQLVERFVPAKQVALFYFVGHGQPDFEDNLFLAVRGTRPEAHLRGVTSLSWEHVRYALRLSYAKTKIVILDCCYANLAGASIGRLGTPDLMDALRGTGALIMTAVSEWGKARYETDPADGPPQTYFTKHFIDVVERGIPGEGPRLRLGPLFNAVAEEMAAAGLPVPVSNYREYVTDFEFADNAAYDQPAPRPAPRPDRGPAVPAGDGSVVPSGRISAILEEQQRRAEQAAFLAAGAVAGAAVTAVLLPGPPPQHGTPDPLHPLASQPDAVHSGVDHDLQPLHGHGSLHSLHGTHDGHSAHASGDSDGGSSGG